MSTTPPWSQPPSGPPLPPPPPPAQACTWHSGRMTGRSCTRCGKPACADCLTPGSVGSLCPDCVRAGRPAMADRVRMRAAGAFDAVTKGLIAVNVAVFIGAAMSGGDAFGTTRWHIKGALIGPSLRDPGTNEVLRGVADGAWWRLVTSGFLHYGPIHLLMNMYVLWTVGPMLERELGRTRYLGVYVASMLGGAAGALIISPTTLTAGASGAIFGLFGAFASGLYKRGINPFKTGIGTTLLINLGLTFALSRYISVGGHLGGLVGGAICGWFMLGYPSRKLPSWTYLVPIAVAAISVALALPAARRF